MDQVILTREQSRAIDKIAIEQYGIPGMVLMENAGRGVVDVLLEIDPSLAADVSKNVVILCGKGNNAGDGFVIARHLQIRGVPTKVILLFSSDELRGDALQNYEILTHCDVPIVDLSAVPDLEVALETEAVDTCWLIDAMLGTGAIGTPREPIVKIIPWFNNHRAQRLAVDVPSGLDCDTGEPAQHTVNADVTCTFVATKAGFFLPAATKFLGQVHVISIGIPGQVVAEVLRQ